MHALLRGTGPEMNWTTIIATTNGCTTTGRFEIAILYNPLENVQIREKKRTKGGRDTCVLRLVDAVMIGSGEPLGDAMRVML